MYIVRMHWSDGPSSPFDFSGISGMAQRGFHGPAFYMVNLYRDRVDWTKCFGPIL